MSSCCQLFMYVRRAVKDRSCMFLGSGLDRLGSQGEVQEHLKTCYG